MIGVISIDIYNHSVILLYQENKDNVSKWVRSHFKNIKESQIDYIKHYIDEVDCEKAGGITFSCGLCSFVVLKDDKYNYVTHECFHAVNYILQDCGVELTESGEAYAYLLGYVTSKVFRLIDKYKEKKNDNGTKTMA